MIPNLLKFRSTHRFLAPLFIAFCTLLISSVTIAAPAMNSQYYTVYEGDTLSGIAQFYGLSVQELMYANALSDADHIHSGDWLYIPARSNSYRQSCRYYHQVAPGQSLSWIAVHYGIDTSALAQANAIYNYNLVKIGDSLCIPIQTSRPAVQQQTLARVIPSYPQPRATAVPPTATPHIPPTPTVNPLNYYPEPNGYAYYTLRIGDTFYSLSIHYQTTEHHLAVLNPGAIIAPGTTLLMPIYGDISMPPTSTPLFYPTITPMPPTSTPIFYPTLTPGPSTATPPPTSTSRPTSTPRPTSTARPLPTPVQPILVEINISPSISQQGFTIDSVGTVSESPVVISTRVSIPSVITATPNGTSSNGTSPTVTSSTPMPTSPPATATPMIPTATPDFPGIISPWVGQYYVDPNLRGEPLYTNHNSDINFNWGSGGPGYGLPDDDFSIRWMTYEELEAGRYTFRVYVEGGIRLYVDGNLLINKWQGNAGNYVAEIDLQEGYHTVQVDYGKIGPNAHIRVWWTKR